MNSIREKIALHLKHFNQVPTPPPTPPPITEVNNTKHATFVHNLFIFFSVETVRKSQSSNSEIKNVKSNKTEYKSDEQRRPNGNTGAPKLGRPPGRPPGSSSVPAKRIKTSPTEQKQKKTHGHIKKETKIQKVHRNGNQQLKQRIVGKKVATAHVPVSQPYVYQAPSAGPRQPPPLPRPTSAQVQPQHLKNSPLKPQSGREQIKMVTVNPQNSNISPLSSRIQPPSQPEPVQDDDVPLDLVMYSKKRQSKPESTPKPIEKKPPTTPTKEQNQPLNLKRLSGGKVFATATVSFKTGPTKKNIKSPLKNAPPPNAARITPVQFPTQSKSPVEPKYDQSRPPPIPPRNPINRTRRRSTEITHEEYKNIPKGGTGAHKTREFQSTEAKVKTEKRSPSKPNNQKPKLGLKPINMAGREIISSCVVKGNNRKVSLTSTPTIKTPTKPTVSTSPNSTGSEPTRDGPEFPNSRPGNRRKSKDFQVEKNREILSHRGQTIEERLDQTFSRANKKQSNGANTKDELHDEDDHNDEDDFMHVPNPVTNSSLLGASNYAPRTVSSNLYH